MSSPADDDDVPIPGPKAKGPDHPWDPDRDMVLNPALTVGRFFVDYLIRIPTQWFRENIIEPNKGPKYYWYHRKFKRALPIDECYRDDHTCMYEADMDYKRGLAVDRETLSILRFRRDSCHFWNATTKGNFWPSENCQELSDTYNREELNFFIKYGDLHWRANVVDAYNKQKHRMIMERRKALREAAESAEEKNESNS